MNPHLSWYPSRNCCNSAALYVWQSQCSPSSARCSIVHCPLKTCLPKSLSYSFQCDMVCIYLTEWVECTGRSVTVIFISRSTPWTNSPSWVGGNSAWDGPRLGWRAVTQGATKNYFICLLYIHTRHRHPPIPVHRCIRCTAYAINRFR